jgi:hypothetical protein
MIFLQISMNFGSSLNIWIELNEFWKMEKKFLALGPNLAHMLSAADLAGHVTTQAEFHQNSATESRTDLTENWSDFCKKPVIWNKKNNGIFLHDLH